MKKKNIIIVAGVIASLAATAAIGSKILNKREEKDPEFTDDTTNRKISDNATFYEKYVKRAIDVSVASVGIVLTAPIVLVASALIYKEDPGNVIFKQKRVGINKSHFNIHKIRSMKQNTGDIPTHLLSKEEQDKMILKTGRFIRKTSIDELSQFVDILRGRMSLIGPRPALWNQDDLIVERDKYGANTVRPGLTGLAQISGRDEMSIETKSMYDGLYRDALRKSSLDGFKMDCKCFFGTIKSVLTSDGVVEGGTGSMDEAQRHYTDEKSKDDLIGNIGFGESVEVDQGAKKRVLITGAGSYIGQSFINYAKENYKDNFEIDELNMMGDTWRDTDFSEYDIVYHVAGLAHVDVGNVSEEAKEKYYVVNTDLTVETAKKAKADGVKEFIFMSSMIVYGDSAPYGKKKVVDRDTVPTPANFYGDSKLQADMAVREIADDRFKVIVLRPPMIYGKGSKGNYPTLAKLAKKLPVFPDVNNKRSMLYVDNLCEFLCQVMLIKVVSQNATVLIPQNAEWIKTSRMVKEIANVSGKNVAEFKALRLAVAISGKVPGKIGGLVNKAFGNSCYAHDVSIYPGIDYQKISLSSSVYITESVDNVEGTDSKENLMEMKPKALMLASVASMIDQFNMDNIRLLIELGFEVDVVADFVDGGTITSERIRDLKQRLKEMGVTVYHVPIPRKITDIDNNIYSYKYVKELCDSKNYKIVHCHSPIGGVIARMAAMKSRKSGTKVIYTAHGFHFYDGAPMKNWILFYPIEKECSRLTDALITINKEDYERARCSFFANKTIYIPGVGVDTQRFNSGLIDIEHKRTEIGVEPSEIMLLSVGQLSERENHELVIKTLSKIKNQNYKYFIIGKGDLKDYLFELINKLGLSNRVILLEYRTDISELCQASDLFISPSYMEGLPIALMEAIACRTEVICSAISNKGLVFDQGDLFDEYNEFDIIKCLNNKLNGKSRKVLLKESETIADINYNHLKQFDLTIVQEEMRQLYFEMGGVLENSQIIRILNQQIFKKELGIELNTRLIFSVGELNKNKNHQVILKAISEMKDKEIHYIIAGDGDNKEYLLCLSRKLGIQKQIHLLGYRNDISDLLKMMDVYCLPSIREGLNVSLMEAMASGLPCIASKIRGNVDLIQDGKGGYLYDCFDIKGFAEGIRCCATSNCYKMGSVSVDAIKYYDYQNVNMKMRDIYIHVCKG